LAFEGLQDQLKEKWAELSASIQESPAFNNLREQFESQTPLAQKAIVIGGSVFLVFMAIYLLPYSYISSSSTYMEQYEENRDLIKGLLKASRSVKAQSPLPVPMNTQEIRGRVDGILKANRLLPDQIGDFQDIPQPAVSGGMIPAAVIQNGVAFQLKKLNVNQIVSVTNAVQNMGNGVKLMGMDIVQSVNQTHYYDVILKVVHFGLPAIASGDEGGAAGKGGGKGRPRPSRPSNKDDEL
jgi:hypothetical protein